MPYDPQDAMAHTAPDPAANWRINVRIDRDPAAIVRVLDAVARLGLIPDRLTVTAASDELDLTLEVSQAGLPVTDRLCAMLGSMPAVLSVQRSPLADAAMGDRP